MVLVRSCIAARVTWRCRSIDRHNLVKFNHVSPPLPNSEININQNPE